LPRFKNIIQQNYSSSNTAQTNINTNSPEKSSTIYDILLILVYIGIIGFELLNYYEMFGINQSQLEKLAQYFNTDISFEQLHENAIEGNYLLEFFIQIQQLYSLIFVVTLVLLFGISFRRIFSLCAKKLGQTSYLINLINISSNFVDLELTIGFDLISKFFVMYFSLYSFLYYTRYSMIQIIDYCEKYSA
jgi:hypothetical protein